MTATARSELLSSMRQMLTAIRVMKNQVPHGAVPGGALGVLSILDLTSGCHLKDLAGRCALDPSTVSRAVAALVKAGLVQRITDPDDGRASVLSVTPAGRRTLTDISTWYDEQLCTALADWNQDDLVTFSALLQRFCTDLTTRYTTSLEAAR